ncbi:hypothetical protein [Sphingomonas sp. LR55]|uniref:hypothetical protein n=1 Tax=Sphingomonas sp. LR55 TaxID=3050231 RepID=UPI002FDF6C2C
MLDPDLRPAVESAPASALPVLHFDQDGRDGDHPVWFDSISQGWRTCFPPPDPYFNAEEGLFGEDAYSRECSDEEAIILDAPRDREIAERTITEGVDRDTWFVAYAIDGGLVDEAGAEAAGATDADRITTLAASFDPLGCDEPVAPAPGARGSRSRPAAAPGRSVAPGRGACTQIPDRAFSRRQTLIRQGPP